MNEVEQKKYDDGFAWGERWAKLDATQGELARLQDYRNRFDDLGWVAWFACPECNDVQPVGERFAAAVKLFSERPGALDELMSPDERDPDYVRGFADGAIGVAKARNIKPACSAEP